MERRNTTALFLDFRDHRDGAAFSVLHQRVSPILRRFAREWGAKPHAIEDILQATFMVACGKAEAFDRYRAVLPWLLGILSIAVHRSNRWIERHPDSARITPCQPPRSPEDLARESELTTAVTAALLHTRRRCRWPPPR